MTEAQQTRSLPSRTKRAMCVVRVSWLHAGSKADILSALNLGNDLVAGAASGLQSRDEVLSSSGGFDSHVIPPIEARVAVVSVGE